MFTGEDYFLYNSHAKRVSNINKDSRKCLRVKITSCVALIASLNYKKRELVRDGIKL